MVDYFVEVNDFAMKPYRVSRQEECDGKTFGKLYSTRGLVDLMKGSFDNFRLGDGVRENLDDFTEKENVRNERYRENVRDRS